MWKGGTKTSNGYKYIKVNFDHPNKTESDGYVMEHRLVIENELGRFLEKKEQVHHINENKTDNRLENLILLPNTKKHTELHKFFDRLCIFY